MTDDPTAKDVREIKHRLEDTEKSVGLLLRANRMAVIGELMENCFRKSVEKVRVFLAIDGESSVNDISQRLVMKGPNVSAIITELVDNDLIRLRDTDGPKKIYEKTLQVKRLKLDKYLISCFKEQLGKKSAGSPNADAKGSQNQDSLPGT